MFATQMISNAISAREVIQFRYKFQMREAEPHLLGYDKNGELTLSAWQTNGLKPGFRDFRVAKLSELQATGRHFERARKGYNPNDSTMSRIIARL